MISPPSNFDQPAVSQAFERLHDSVKHWIWSQGWQTLHAAQEAAAVPILGGRVDVVVAAPTASGKTEAAFLPIVSRLVEVNCQELGVLYVAPLKALINDQQKRLQSLCEATKLSLTPWHGDVGSSLKKRFFARPTPILLITPESLEALFCHYGTSLRQVASTLRYIVVDELHAFIGTERGRHLQSLLHRVEQFTGGRIPRVGLSATLGDMALAQEFLRPGGSVPSELIVSDGDGQELRLQLRGYREREPFNLHENLGTAISTGDLASVGDVVTGDYVAIAHDIFRVIRGESNLVFANSRRKVEMYSDLLRRLSERERLPNEFFPHHANLSRDLRHELEARLKRAELPTTAICTSTLELGIDIGSVKSVLQVGAPPSVASMRQRLGRSGRRGQPAIMRLYIQESDASAESSLQDKLRVELVQSIAMVNLLLQRWYEPPVSGRLHLSTLVQQVLSLIVEHGGVRAKTAWRTLCEMGPFKAVNQQLFVEVLRSLGQERIIEQDPDGTLALGDVGERIVNHYSFYSAFTSSEEYRLVCGDETLGTLPVDSPVYKGAFVIFAGRRWEVLDVDSPSKVVIVKPAGAGKAPKFGGTCGLIDNRVREVMREVYSTRDVPIYLDAEARALLQEGRTEFSRLGLMNRRTVCFPEEVFLFPWCGDRAMNTLLLQLSFSGFKAVQEGICLRIETEDAEAVRACLKKAASEGFAPANRLAEQVKNKVQEKYDGFLTKSLLCAEYASSHIDTVGARHAISNLLSVETS